MRRTFWFGAGAATAVYVSRKVRRASERVMPAGLADQMLAWRAGLRVFVDDVRAGTAEREAELRRALEVSEPARRPPMLGATTQYSDVA
jgi:hypothetical protein